MERFNNLMDDIKDALILSTQRKKLYLPAILVNVILIIAGIIIIGIIVAMVFSATASGLFDSLYPDWEALFGFLIGPVLMAILLVLLLAVLFIAVDIGITGMVIGTVDGEVPSSALFFAAVKKHLWSVMLTKIGLGLLILLSAILWVIPWLIYTLIIGTTTMGWGMIFLTCAVQTLIGFWVLIKVEDQRGGFESIAVNLRFGRSNFWLLVLVFYMQMKLASFLPGLLGVIGAMIATLFISYCTSIFFKIVLLKTYRRYRVEGINQGQHA